MQNMHERKLMVKISFQLEENNIVEAFASCGDNLLEIARKNNIVIDAPCSGNGSCGKCKVQLISGALVSERTRHISEAEYNAGWRLACISTVEEDVTIRVPDVASAFKNRMKVADLSSHDEILIFEQAKKEIEEAGIVFENNFEVISLNLEMPTLDDTMPDNERVIRGIKEATGIDTIELSYQVLVNLPDILRESDFHIKCVIEKQKDGIKVYDITKDTEQVVIAGLAVDIGTTTVSAMIINMETGDILAKASAGNGQIRYGADVINRIIESTKQGGRKRLQKAIIEETMNPLIMQMCQSANISKEHIYCMCVAANTTMNHLFVGVNANPLRMEPYIPAFFELDSLKAKDLGIQIASDARIIVAPNIGSYVGGDITAGTLTSMIWNKPEFSLFVDLGTNGELVFGNEDFLMSCACSAGPAFEGGDISCGMRATDEAIEACTIDKETMEPSFTVIGEEGQKPIGLCGSGIIDVISELFRCGIINAKGIFTREGSRIKHDEDGMGSYVLAFHEETGTIKDVSINEVDIDNFIRAKGAIFSAINLMLSSLDFDISMIEHVYVAGGIGSGINMKNAVSIGMFPDIEIEKYHYIGNSSLAGAYAMLLSNQAEEKVQELERNMTYMELSTNPRYMDEFVAACFLPHTDATLFPSIQ